MDPFTYSIGYQNGFEDAKKQYEVKWHPYPNELPEQWRGVLVWCAELKNVYCAYYEYGHWYIFGADNRLLTEEVSYWANVPNPLKISVMEAARESAKAVKNSPEYDFSCATPLKEKEDGHTGC